MKTSSLIIATGLILGFIALSGQMMLFQPSPYSELFIPAIVLSCLGFFLKRKDDKKIQEEE